MVYFDSHVSTILNQAQDAIPQAGGSREAPIVLADSSPPVSPMGRSQPPPPPKTLYSIFAPKKQGAGASSGRYAKASTKVPTLVPFPDHETQHVHGPRTVAQCHLSQFARRRLTERGSLDSFSGARPKHHTFPRRSTEVSITPIPLETLDPGDHQTRRMCRGMIPAHHRHYPAIGRALNGTLSHSYKDDVALGGANMLWSDKWRPRRADQVLGNEQSALYLRDWLLNLKLHINGPTDGTATLPDVASGDAARKTTKARKGKEARGVKRPRIVRNVERKRRRVDSEEPEDSWIVDTSSDDPLDIMQESEDDFDLPQLSRLKRADGDDSPDDHDDNTSHASGYFTPLPPADGVATFDYIPTEFGDTIYNTILLAGPPGCGKTASVYACAEELGWDVFEVYPGIGERSGAALQKLIGEVGKNHLVRQTQHAPKGSTAEAKPKTKKLDFFSKRRVVSDDEGERPETPQSIASAAPESLESATPSEAVATEVSQSIVLIEEVDVLFRDDINFWPALIKIIRECKRPVVLTCSGEWSLE